LRPLTADKPKAMVELNGKPIMAYQLEWLSSYGIEEIIVACGYRAEVMQQYFGDGSRWNVNITYLREPMALGRGGALKSAVNYLFERNAPGLAEPLIALNGDLITNLPLDKFIAFFEKERPLAVVATVPLVSPYGIMAIDGDSLVSGFTEKPELPYWINAGMYAFTGEIMNLLPDVGDHEVLTLPQLAARGELRAFKSDFFWRTVDTIKDVNAVQAELKAKPRHLIAQ
jgi:NDP-sugar pyrophosphorylase family protein